MLPQITPLILTYNEAPNIKRTLDNLTWARDIVIVDSHSTDETVEIIKLYPNVRLYQRKFDSHARQWEFGLRETDIQSPWVLSLDADWQVVPSLVKELQNLDGNTSIAAYSIGFEYLVFGKAIRGSLYPPVNALFQPSMGEFIEFGHTQIWQTSGKIVALQNKIQHDDRKSFLRWLNSQHHYMRMSQQHLENGDWQSLDWADRIRKYTLLSPLIIFFYTLIIRGSFLSGYRGMYYALQKCVAELILLLIQWESKISNTEKQADNDL